VPIQIRAQERQKKDEFSRASLEAIVFFMEPKVVLKFVPRILITTQQDFLPIF